MNLKRTFNPFLLVLIAIIGLQSCKDKKENKSIEKAEATMTEQDGFVQIFDGKTLDNWEGDPNYWKVENGNLVGEFKICRLSALPNNKGIVL